MEHHSTEKLFKKIDVIILLSTLLIFSMGIGLLHGDTTTATAIDDRPERIFADLTPLLITDGASQVAKTLKEYPKQMIDVIVMIINDTKTSFARNDEVRLIFKLARYYLNDKDTLAKLFNLLTRKDYLTKGDPILYLAAKGKHRIAIPSFLAWADEMTKKSPIPPAYAPLTKQITRALAHTVAQNDLETLKHMTKSGIPVTKEQATALLLQVVRGDKDPAFVAFLDLKMADINAEYPDHKGYTPLIQAVDNQNIPMIKALLNIPFIKINLIKDPATGSALQHAINLRNTEIDTLLREHGARETLPKDY